MKPCALFLALLTFGLGSCAGPAPVESAPTAVVNSSPKGLQLKNGTRLVGTIERETGGKILFNADLLGTLTIDASARLPEGARPDMKAGILLKNGTMIVGVIEKKEGGKVFVNAELLGRLVIDSAALAQPTP